MRCHPFQPRTRICQAAHYAADLVEDTLHFELAELGWPHILSSFPLVKQEIKAAAMADFRRRAFNGVAN